MHAISGRLSTIGLLFAMLLLGAAAQTLRAEEHGFREHEAREHAVWEHEFREHEFRDHQFLDARYHHNHYYPPRGYVFGGLPPHPEIVFHGGLQFYFAEGVWYRSDLHAHFVVVAPPIGIVVPVLPAFYTTVWVHGAPYYYANDVYYVRAPQGYVVVDPPPANVVVEQPPATAPPPATNVAQAPTDQLFVYPRQGQSAQQEATDRYECHRWAINQTGYDPTLAPAGSASGQKHADYQRALGACLDGRGYTMK